MSNVTALENPLHRMVPGAVVKLKSGGPHMTIRDIGGELVCCSWFKDSGEWDLTYFRVRELELVK